MIRAIAFDLFDTLVDQNHHRLQPVEIEGRRFGATTPALHARLVERTGMDLPLVEFAQRLREIDATLRAETVDQGIELSTLDRFVAFANHLGCDDVLAVARELTEVHMDLLHGAVSVPAHHEPVLAALGVEHPLALCSNFTHAATARRILDEAGFDAHLDVVVISEEVGIRKPRREIFEAMVEALGVAPREILHVGDDLEADVAGAAAAGLRTLWLTRRVVDPEAALARHRGARPDFALDDLLDLPVLVARLAAQGVA
ncbi:MAG: HAD family hydrolase [Spirochaetaceae bacterium]|nr:HAD family hydrolase [Spirochaetaceae bacterium]